MRRMQLTDHKNWCSLNIKFCKPQMLFFHASAKPFYNTSPMEDKSPFYYKMLYKHVKSYLKSQLLTAYLRFKLSSSCLTTFFMSGLGFGLGLDKETNVLFFCTHSRAFKLLLCFCSIQTTDTIITNSTIRCVLLRDRSLWRKSILS